MTMERGSRVDLAPRIGYAAPSAKGQRARGLPVERLEVAVIGTGWCGGIRAETLSRSALPAKLHICEIRPDRLAEVKALFWENPERYLVKLSASGRRESYER